MAASGGESGLTALLVCRVGEKICGISLPQVVETLRPLPIEPLANLPEPTLGLSMIRGRPTPVLDARRLLGSASASKPGRFVTFRLEGSRVAALAVDQVIGVRRVDRATLAELPPLARGEGDRDPVSALGTLEHELLVVLAHARLLPDSVWTQIAAEPSA